jgi:hypothetical protein
MDDAGGLPASSLVTPQRSRPGPRSGSVEHDCVRRRAQSLDGQIGVIPSDSRQAPPHPLQPDQLFTDQGCAGPRQRSRVFEG